MSDFYSIDLDTGLDQYSWTELPKKGKFEEGTHPGNKSRHALLAGKDKIYLFGGFESPTKSSNSTYEFDPETEEWKKLDSEIVGESIPCLDTFGSVLVCHG